MEPTVPPPEPPDSPDAWYAPGVHDQYALGSSVVATVRSGAGGFRYEVREPSLSARTESDLEAVREYIEDTADSETFQELVAARYYDDQLDFETVKQLVGAETAQRLRLLKSDLEDEPLDIETPVVASPP